MSTSADLLVCRDSLWPSYWRVSAYEARARLALPKLLVIALDPRNNHNHEPITAASDNCAENTKLVRMKSLIAIVRDGVTRQDSSRVCECSPPHGPNTPSSGGRANSCRCKSRI